MGDVINLFSQRKISTDTEETAPKESTLDVPALTDAYNKKQERMNDARKQNNNSVTQSYRLKKPTR